MSRLVLLIAAAAVCWMQTACRPTPKVVNPPAIEVDPYSLPVPQHIRRLAVWYPRASEREAAYGYSRLEQAAFQLRTQRAGMTILERRNIGPLTDEQRLQASGRIDDDSAVRIGRWIGADSLVLFQIDVPTWRDRLLARFHERMPPFVVSSKIISVESGEVLYHDVVRAVPVPPSGEWADYASDHELQPAMHAALDEALSRAIARLHRSFREDPSTSLGFVTGGMPQARFARD
ncbi:MAG TPA: hypothetical protein VJ746_16095 [Nitrospira sp.]|nr:hypothetical protein [Nitrospira sp.]